MSKVTVTANVSANVIAKSIKSWISLPATPSASASSVVTRDANGNVQVGMPVNDADAAPKSFVESNSSKVGTSAENIMTTDETNFPGMNGKYAVVPGFTNDGFHYGTVVCSQTDPAYEFPFVGSITSEMASGTVIKPSVAPTYISVVDPAVTFIYEYLW